MEPTEDCIPKIRDSVLKEVVQCDYIVQVKMAGVLYFLVYRDQGAYFKEEGRYCWVICRNGGLCVDSFFGTVGAMETPLLPRVKSTKRLCVQFVRDLFFKSEFTPCFRKTLHSSSFAISR